MSKKVFITATGTDIGKTFISALIVKKLRENDVDAGYYKPALSGALLDKGKLIPGDVDYVCSKSGLDNKYEELVSYVFETAVSPHLAAKINNVQIDKENILDHYLKLKDKFEFLVVEGCGGIICPLNMDNELIMLTDIIKMMNIKIVIVASSGLGTINTTVLTIEYARSLNIGISGIILNNYEEDNFLHQDNKEKIEKLTGIKVISCVKKDSLDLEIDIEELKSIFV
ncbi:dethiobiotin synthase [Clostridioides mangenotii]|uniref:dethiobiotin synthase n=1 Tax=Metaclostridioides mangenotii TaxID=1540 RepID=UPI002149B6A9|nr:dethiobiotin synthase [Clostridioides mangenotii]MCR1954280.1 dethiobiotin synthase [Clostridioides mangenotii]